MSGDKSSRCEKRGKRPARKPVSHVDIFCGCGCVCWGGGGEHVAMCAWSVCAWGACSRTVPVPVTLNTSMPPATPTMRLKAEVGVRYASTTSALPV
jgi:hypothetical protein